MAGRGGKIHGLGITKYQISVFDQLYGIISEPQLVFKEPVILDNKCILEAVKKFGCSIASLL